MWLPVTNGPDTNTPEANTGSQLHLTFLLDLQAEPEDNRQHYGIVQSVDVTGIAFLHRV